MTKCAMCDQPVDPDGLFWKEVTGWVGGPKKDSMRLREDTGRLAHEACVQAMLIGQPATAPTLFDEVPDPRNEFITGFKPVVDIEPNWDQGIKIEKIQTEPDLEDEI